MTTATGEFSIDFSGLSDVNPYTNADFTIYTSTLQIQTGGVRPGVNSGTAQALYTGGAQSGDVIKSKVEGNLSSTEYGDQHGPIIADTSGDGYYVSVNGDNIKVWRLDGFTPTSLGSTIFASAYAANSIVEAWYDKASGDIDVYIADVFVGSRNDSTHSANALQAGFWTQWDNTNARKIVSFAADGYAALGPTVDSITDPIIGTEPVTIVTSEPVPTVDTIEFTVGTVTQSQSYSTGDNITHTIATPTRNLLPPIGTVTASLKAGVTEITSTTATLQEPAGWGVQTLSGVVDEDAVPHTGTLENGMIAYWDDYPNTLTNAGLTDITQVIPRAVNFYIWDPVAEEYGTVSAFTYNAGEDSTVIGSIINSVIIQSIIS